MSPSTAWTSDAVLSSLRRFLLVLLVLGLCGIGADLVALAHYEDSWQLAPLVLIALALFVVGWHLLDGTRMPVRVLRLVMVMFIVAGVTGIVLHYRGNLEFQLEIDPSQGHWSLFKKVIRAHSPPALAPGAMAQLGLLGLAYTYRHPATKRTD
jgi:hypothetical protein